MIDLVAELSELDKARIKNYLTKYGSPAHIIPLEEYLADWSKNKQKLYKMLGNKFIVESEYKYTKPFSELEYEFSNHLLFVGDSPILIFYNYIRDFINKYDEGIPHMNKDTSFKQAINDIYYNLITKTSLANNKITFSIKYKFPGHDKELKLQSGGKLLKAIQKIVKYFEQEMKNYSSEVDPIEKFEEFRLAHSRVTNDKEVKGRICISIHPLDFITMSDNENNWESCMNWQMEGCYRTGTVEMLNSNCTVCCYIHNPKNQFRFYLNRNERKKHDSSKITEDWIWNSKKWRQLFYVTKDIMVGGKAYPYQNESITTKILNILRDLAKDNLNWTYKYGIEPYKDMLHLVSLRAIDRARYYRRYSPKKKNIIFHSNSMYNDLICYYPEINFLCYRNKVKKTTIINISGPAKCLCCGDNLLYENEYFSDEYYDIDSVEHYHDRYAYTDSVVCLTCKDEYYKCEYCEEVSMEEPLKTITYKGKEIRVCEYCQKGMYKCPCCGEYFNIHDFGNFRYFAISTPYKGIQDLEILSRKMRSYQDPYFDTVDNIKKIYACSNCIADFYRDFNKIEEIDPDIKTEDIVGTGFYSWELDNTLFKFGVDFNDEKYNKCFYRNLVPYVEGANVMTEEEAKLLESYRKSRDEKELVKASVY